MENVSVLSPTTFPRNHSGLACIVSLGQQHLSSCLSLALLFFASDKGTAGKCRRSASSMYRGMLAWSAHVKKLQAMEQLPVLVVLREQLQLAAGWESLGLLQPEF